MKRNVGINAHSHISILWMMMLILIFHNTAFAQDWDLTPEKMRIYTEADGLPNNSILTIAQDKNNNLWIGTRTGVSRFDGKTFINFGAKDGFSDKQVWAILCDTNGNIWFGTDGDGLFLFDGKKWKRKRKLSFCNGFLYEDREGNIWGGSQVSDIFKLSPNKNFQPMHFNIIDASENSNGNLFFLDSNGSLQMLHSNSQKDTFQTLYRFNNADAIQIFNDIIWVSTFDSISRSTDFGKTFSKFSYDKSVGFCWDMFIDRNNQIWTANDNYVVRFDGSKFHYYNTEKGLSRNYTYYIFQDKQGHLWFATASGLVQLDNIPPKLQITDAIPQVIKSQTFSFHFSGDDGQFGSASEYLFYFYKFTDEKEWKRAENGFVNLDNLIGNIEYTIQLRVTDSFNNSTESEIKFKVKIDAGIPSVLIINKDEFSQPLEKDNFSFHIEGKDDKIQPKELVYRYKLEKNRVHQDWSEKWTKNLKRIPFTKMQSGDYTFSIQAKNKSGNASEVVKLTFRVDLIEDKPQITLGNLTGCYFIEEEDHPVSKCDHIMPNQKIMFGRIAFAVENIDIRPEKKNLQYAVRLQPIHRDWTIYKDNNQYEFSDLADGEYVLNVRAKDTEDFVSKPLKFPFTVNGFHKLPQTMFKFGEPLRKGKIVGKFIDLCWESKQSDCTYSYQLDNEDWSVFNSIKCLELPLMPSGRHIFRVLAKNEHGIEPFPAFHEFEYERIHDMPVVKLLSSPEKVSAKNTVEFRFEGKDDMEQGDKTPIQELKYSWRLIPVSSDWSRPSSDTKAFYSGLKNGSYFFQVKVFDKSENECVVPAEWYFEIRKIPFYQEPWFYWSVSIGGIFLAVFSSVFFTLRRIRQNIYEQRYNPYIVGEAVHDPEMFFGRAVLMKDLFQSLKNNSICLTGERRIGKTTMLEHLEKNAQKPLFSFFCNLEGVKENLFFSRIMQHFVNKINLLIRNTPMNLALFSKERQDYDEVDFEEDIEEILAFLQRTYDPKVSVIICLDEIDATQDFSNETHSSLRNVFQTYQGSIRLAAAGVSIRRGNWRLPTSPWYNFFEFKNITALDRTSAETLIIKPVKGFYKYEPKALDFILKKTDGKPFYIQMICKKAIGKILDEKRTKVTVKDLSQIYNDLIHLELNREFEKFWEELSSNLQKKIVEAVSEPSIWISKEYESELMKNNYNYAHRIIAIHEGKIKFSAIFADWLRINYSDTK